MIRMRALMSGRLSRSPLTLTLLQARHRLHFYALPFTSHNLNTCTGLSNRRSFSNQVSDNNFRKERNRLSKKQENQRDLDNKIVKLFDSTKQTPGGPHSGSRSVSLFIMEEARSLNASSLATLFHSIGKNNFNITRGEHITPLVDALAAINEKSSSSISVVVLGKIFYGLKSFNSRSAEVLHLIKTISASVRAMNQSLTAVSISASEPEPPPPYMSLSDSSIFSIFSGLKNFSSASREVRELLSELTVLLNNCPISDHISSRAVSGSLFGLRNMTTQSPEVIGLLGALLVRVKTSPCRLEGGQLALAIAGLKGMDSKYPVVRKMIAALAEKGSVEGAAGGVISMTAKELSMSLHGLMNKSSHNQEVRDLLPLLTSAVAAHPLNSLDSNAIGISLYGLRNMSSFHIEVRALLSALASRVAESSSTERGRGGGFTSGQEISNVLYGLQNMSADHFEVLELLSKIASKIAATPLEVEMSGIELSAAVYGLKGLSSNFPPVTEVLAQLTRRIASSRKLYISSVSLKNLLFGLQSMTNYQKEVRDFLAAVLCHLSKQKSDGVGKSVGSGASETTHADSLRQGEFIGTSMYGLREMSCEHAEVRAVLSMILNHVAAGGGGGFKELEISNTLYGLQNMSSEREEVRSCISKVTEALKQFGSSAGGSEGEGERRGGNVFTGQGKGMCVHGMQDMKLQQPEVEDLTVALIHMLEHSAASVEAEQAAALVSSGARSYSDLYFKSDSLNARDEHALGGLMLALYGVSSLYYNTFFTQSTSTSASGKRSSNERSNILPLFSFLNNNKLDVTENIEGVVESVILNDSEGSSKYRNLIFALLKSLSVSFAKEEEMVFGGSLESIRPIVAMKSLLNLRRNVNLLLVLLDRSTVTTAAAAGGGGLDQARETEVMTWLRNIDKKCNNAFSSLTPDRRLTEVSAFTASDGNSLLLKHPFEFRQKPSRLKTLCNFLKEIAPENQEFEENSLYEVPSHAIQYFVDEEYELLNAEESVFNILLKLLLSGSYMGEGEGDASGKSTTSSFANVAINERCDIVFISNSKWHNYDICITKNEILFGFDSDIVVRLYEREAPTAPSSGNSEQSVIPSSFGNLPVRIFNIEVDGHYHIYPKKKKFSILRDFHVSSDHGRERFVEVTRIALDSNSLNRYTHDELTRLIICGTPN